MYHFEYLPKSRRNEVKLPIIELISKVQNDLRDKFTFQYNFSGSGKLNMIAYDLKTNTGFDFDKNIEVNDSNEDYSPKELKHLLMNSFNNF